jgi:hypothetical protein
MEPTGESEQVANPIDIKRRPPAHLRLRVTNTSLKAHTIRSLPPLFHSRWQWGVVPPTLHRIVETRGEVPGAAETGSWTRSVEARRFDKCHIELTTELSSSPLNRDEA